jgi:predicted component of type VI protein secretion system
MDKLTLTWQAQGQTHSHDIRIGQKYLIGRQKGSCDIVLSDPSVSRQHASIYTTGETFYLRNESQKNTINFNSRFYLTTSQAIPIHPGDSFSLGGVTFRVEAPRPTIKIFKIRCAQCDHVVDYNPESFCPWCGRALANGETVFEERQS